VDISGHHDLLAAGIALVAGFIFHVRPGVRPCFNIQIEYSVRYDQAAAEIPPQGSIMNIAIIGAENVGSTLGKIPRTTWPLVLSLLLASTALAQHQIVCSGEAAGGYAAFPDVCRLQNGDLYCVFYSGYGHVSRPNDKWPKGGRIMAVRSTDNGKTWSKPVVAIDTDQDDRDPSVASLKDGTLLLNWFTLQKNQAAILLSRSTDNGKNWSKPVQLKLDSPYSFACSNRPGQHIPA
jgi:hypothetical protein